MRKVDALATLPHYQDHLLPIWNSLPAEVRGIFWVAGRGVDSSSGQQLNLAKLSSSSDLLLVAGANDAQKARRRPLVYVEHGAGQTYLGVSSSSYSGAKGYDSVALFICPSETVAARWRATYPDTPAAVVGCPRLDRWHCNIGSRDSTPNVALTFHWSNPLCPEANWALPAYKAALPQLKEACEARGLELLGHGHPRAWGPLARVWDQLGIRKAPSWESIMGAQLLIGDNSSALPEWASLGRPVLWLNAPTWRREVWHGGRFWDWPMGQVSCDTGAQLVAKLDEALEDPPEVRAARAQMVQAVYSATDGRAADRAAEAILEVL